MDQLIIENVKVVDAQQDGSQATTVVIEGDRITAIGEGASAQPVRDPAAVLDLTGCFLMPGMTLGHSHLESDVWLGSLRGEVWLGTERPPGVLMAYAIKNAAFVLESGITLTIGAGSIHDIDVSLKMAIEEKVVTGPRIVPCGPHLQALGSVYPEARWWYGMTNTGIEQGMCSGPDAFRQGVRQQIYRGAEIIKLFPSQGHGFPDTPGRRNVSKDELAAVVAAAHELGKRVRTHVVYRDLILECIEQGVDIIDHGDYIDSECMEAMLERGTAWAPSLHSSFCYLMGGGVDREGYGRDQTFYERICGNVLEAYKAGVPILPGDDYGSRVFRHAIGIYGRELSILQRDAGLSPQDVIRCATVAGPQAVGLDRDLGTVEVGKLADLVVLTANPLDDITVFERPVETLKYVIQSGVITHANKKQDDRQ